MQTSIQRDVPAVVACKICAAPAMIFGAVDFNRTCGSTTVPVPSGIPIRYHRCPVCGLIFTVAFDRFTAADFAREIYNAGYLSADPDYLERRPAANASLVINSFHDARNLKILDYGGGNGKLAERLVEAGFTRVQTYDPFVPQFATRPTEQFDVVLSFEVAEHSTTPRQTFADMVSFLTGEGAIFFSTGVQPPDIAAQGMNWWYIGPRNGHVTLFSRDALIRLAIGLGMNIASTGKAHHLLYRQIPTFAAKWFGG